MKPDCNILNPLQRDGLSQDKRLIRALHPSHVAIDEKDISDLLLYAKSYAQLIQYYSLENNPSGDWKKFIESDVTTLVATIEKFNAKALKTRFEEAVKADNYLNQFNILLETIQVAYDWFQDATPELRLHTALERVINSILNNTLITVIAYAKRIEEVNNTVLTVNDLALGFSPIDIGTIQADTSLFPGSDLTQADDKLLAKRKIKKTFDAAYESVLSIVFQAPGFLEETLEEYHQHNPHMALFLAFLKLFKIAQNHLNTITKRHLDYYYQEVLQLNLKPEQPDEVHLVFKLAKNFQEELVKEDTLLKAGKDDFGANVFFGLDNDIVVNKTQLYEGGLKTIFLDKDYQPDGLSPNLLINQTPYRIHNLYAAPKANTKDGIEEELEKNEKWKTFGDATMPGARIGFAISSPIFLLREGDRTITVIFYAKIAQGTAIDFQDGDQNTRPIAHELMHNILVQYSAEEEWVPCKTAKVEIRRTSATHVEVEFELNIPPEEPALIAFNKEVLAPALDTTFPTLYFLINGQGDQLIPSSNPYRYLQALLMEKLYLSVSVDGVQNLVLENDVGVINPAKPFLPFGPIPKVGSKFYIGNHEVFSKKLNELAINLEWADLPLVNFSEHYENYLELNSTTSPVDNNQYFNADFEILHEGQWLNSTGINTPIDTTDFQLFTPPGNNDAPDVERGVVVDFNGKAYGEHITPFGAFSYDLKRGFIRLNLKQDFLHKKYPKWLAGSLKQAGANDTPNEPYTPTISTFKVNYRASETIDFSQQAYKDSAEQFFHIGPFGWQKFYANDDNLPKKEAIFSQRFVPEFQVVEKLDGENTASTDAEGTLYIGLEDLEPEQNVSILFQMAEGSSDPDLQNQPVVWSYLAHNHWIDFDRTQVLSDTTNGLLTSGIVTFTMPRQMTNENTILDSGVYWIKVSVARLTTAVSQAIVVIPQAVKGSFRKTEINDLSRLKNPLPAEVIGKLKERKAIIKSVAQPFSSFNGKLIEQDFTPKGIVGEDRFSKQYNEFYIRISERLRHKNRAVTIDDYERIVLQQFPDVYKVKCINHTRILDVDENGVEIPASEHAPGSVKLVVIPSLKNRNAVNPLQPRVSSNRLDEIANHLMPLKSDFVTLKVQNPIFEEVSVDFKVRFLPGFDKGFYEKKLKEDIVLFLSPWLHDEGGDLALGGKVHRSVILNFVEETEYVDYVTDFKLNHIIPGQNDRINVEEAVAATSSSVIVSVPAMEHLIDPNTLEAC